MPGRRLLTYEFEDEAAAQEQVGLVSPDGSGIGNKFVGWRETPHFYTRGRLIVVYLGDDEKMIDALQQALGPQFAGE